MVIPIIGTRYMVSFFFSLLFSIILAEAWSIFSGYTGYINLGPVASLGVGAYLMAQLGSAVPFLGIVSLSSLAGAAMGFLIGLPSLRIRGPYFAILTLGVAEILKFIVLNIGITTQATIAHTIIGPDITFLYYLLTFLAAISILSAYLIRSSKFGLGLLSIRSDEDAAEATGVNTTWYKLAAFAISSSFAGALGPILASRLSYIDPYTVFDPLISFQVVVMAILGGSGDVLGPILGAVLITILSELLISRYPFHYTIILGSVLIVIVTAAPSGLVGVGKSIIGRGTKNLRINLRKVETQ